MDSPYLRGSVLESPVGLVLAEAGGSANAMTVSFFSEVAHHPTTLWVSIAARCYTHELIQSSGRFSLIVLQEKQKEIAEKCSSVSGRDQDKCAGLNLYRSEDSFLYLPGALASISCKVRSVRPVDDHTLFIADILSGESDSKTSFRRHLLTTDLL